MTKNRLIVAIMCIMLLAACTSHDNRPALPKDLPPPNNLSM